MESTRIEDEIREMKRLFHGDFRHPGLASRLDVLEKRVVDNDRYSRDMRVQTVLILVAIIEGFIAILLWFLS